MEFTASVCRLTHNFLKTYPEKKYPELMCKAGRPYSCLLLDTHDNYFICIPFRSHIRHKNAYLFHGTERSKRSESGLDYTKIVLIAKGKYKEYMDAERVVVDQDEYKEVRLNLIKIAEEASDYVEKYLAHVTGEKPMHPRQFLRKYQYSTLRYFHEVMGIEEK